MTAKTPNGERLAAQLQPLVRRFKSLPKGTRFRYRNGAAGETVFVLLEHYDCGLIAKWEGIDGPVECQQVFCLAETPAECETFEVEVVE